MVKYLNLMRNKMLLFLSEFCVVFFLLNFCKFFKDLLLFFLELEVFGFLEFLMVIKVRYEYYMKFLDFKVFSKILIIKIVFEYF